MSDKRVSPMEEAANALRGCGLSESHHQFIDYMVRIAKLDDRAGVSKESAADVLVNIVGPALSNDGEHGHVAIFDHQIDSLIVAIARALEARRAK